MDTELIHKKLHPNYMAKKPKNTFGIVHYADSVCYTIEGFMEKNKDTLHECLAVILRESTNTFISQCFPKEDTPQNTKG